MSLTDIELDQLCEAALESTDAVDELFNLGATDLIFRVVRTTTNVDILNYIVSFADLQLYEWADAFVSNPLCPAPIQIRVMAEFGTADDGPTNSYDESLAWGCNSEEIDLKESLKYPPCRGDVEYNLLDGEVGGWLGVG